MSFIIITDIVIISFALLNIYFIHTHIYIYIKSYSNDVNTVSLREISSGKLK